MVEQAVLGAPGQEEALRIGQGGLWILRRPLVAKAAHGLLFGLAFGQLLDPRDGGVQIGLRPLAGQ
ncbi:MAG: hypothetical protein U1F83_19335 [Verrucomicrobiota bacterium]